MELGEVDGQLRYLKKDGSPAMRTVNDLDRITYYGFPELAEKVWLRKGNPKTDDLILADMSLSRKKFGTFLLKKSTQECVQITRDDVPFAEELVARPPAPDVRLETVVREHVASRRDSVDIESLAENRGMRVYPAKAFDGFWCKEAGEVKDIPEGWALLPKGDASLTRAVKRGPHWVFVRSVSRGRRYFTETIGVFAPAETIATKYEELGGDAGREQREAGKAAAVRSRAESMRERLEDAIRGMFPGMPNEDVEETLSFASSRGAVGRADFLMSSSYGEGGAEGFNTAAYLAVRAHARHRHTDYEERLAALPPEDFLDEGAKAEVRREVAADIEVVLDRWRQPPR